MQVEERKVNTNYVHQTEISAGLYQTPTLQARIQAVLDQLNAIDAFTYAASDDFGLNVKKLLFPKCSDGIKRVTTGLKNNHLVKNIVYFAEMFGFEVVFSKNIYCTRDTLIKCKDKIYLPNDSANIPLAIARNQSRSLHFSDSASFLTDHSFFRGQPGVFVQQTKLPELAYADLVAFFGQSKEVTPYLHFYLEGGNHYVMTNKEGKKVVLFGEDVLYTTLNQFRRDGIFKNGGMEKYLPIFEKKLAKDAALLEKTLEEMYVQGLIETGPGKEKGFVSAEEMATIVQSSKLGSPQEMAQRLGYYKHLKLSDMQKTSGIKIAAEYLVQKEGVKDFFLTAFGVENVCFVPKLDYHLDVFLCPGPKGSIFMQDYSFTVELLEEILSLELTDPDLAHLKRYLETAKKLERELGQLNNKVKEELERAGFIVIPAPGLFYDEDGNTPMCNLNFLNARTGWSPKTNTYYYLTTGASVPVLMSAYEKFLKSFVPDIQVGFLGFDPENEKDFSQGMSFLNYPMAQAGPHCFAFAMESEETKTPNQG